MDPHEMQDISNVSGSDLCPLARKVSRSLRFTKTAWVQWLTLETDIRVDFLITNS